MPASDSSVSPALLAGNDARRKPEPSVGCTLAFSAGAFLCISLTDLIPEALSHSHDKLKLSGALLLGSALTVAIELLSGQSHAAHGEHEQRTAEEHDSKHAHEQHDHAGHAH